MLQFFYDGGLVMWLLLAASVLSLTFICERGWALRRRCVIPEALEGGVEYCRTEQDVRRLRTRCEQKASPAGRLLLTIIECRGWEKSAATDTLQTRARQEVMKLEKGLVMIEVIVGVAPLLGLVGTLHGLIELFGSFGGLVTGDNSELAVGISIALNTTLTGLLIAIPSLIAWSYFSRKVEALAVELEALCDDFLQRFYVNGNQFADPEAAGSDRH